MVAIGLMLTRFPALLPSSALTSRVTCGSCNPYLNVVVADPQFIRNVNVREGDNGGKGTGIKPIATIEICTSLAPVDLVVSCAGRTACSE